MKNSIAHRIKEFHRPYAWCLFLGIILSGCQQNSQITSPAPTDKNHGEKIDSKNNRSTGTNTKAASLNPGAITKTDEDAVHGSKKELQAILKPGAAYGLIREKLIEKGWEPVPNPDCKAEVVGGDWQNICSTSPTAGCKACEGMEELNAYSGDGVMLARFKNKFTGKIISVNATGEISDWKNKNKNSDLQYTSWEFENSH